MANLHNLSQGEQPQAADHRPFVSAAQVGERAGVHKRTVLNWASAGIIPTKIRVGKLVRFDLEQVLAALEGQGK